MHLYFTVHQSRYRGSASILLFTHLEWDCLIICTLQRFPENCCLMLMWPAALYQQQTAVWNIRPQQTFTELRYWQQPAKDSRRLLQLFADDVLTPSDHDLQCTLAQLAAECEVVEMRISTSLTYSGHCTQLENTSQKQHSCLSGQDLPAQTRDKSRLRHEPSQTLHQFSNMLNFIATTKIHLEISLRWTERSIQSENQFRSCESLIRLHHWPDVNKLDVTLIDYCDSLLLSQISPTTLIL